MKNKEFYHSRFVYDLENVLNTKSIYVELPESFYKRTAIHVVWVFAHWLFKHMKWLNQLQGPVILIEHDAYLNFMNQSQYYCMWNKLYATTKIDCICSSGKVTTERLNEQKIKAHWIPKGCDPNMLTVANHFTGRICSFTRPFAQRNGIRLPFYKSRNDMEKSIQGLVDVFESDTENFCKHVAQYSAGCQNDASMNEPMAKHFECSAMQCVPIRDRQQELYDLGYDDQSMICYDSINDLREIINHYQKHPEKLIPFQNRARLLTRKHTWTDRAIAIKELLEQFK